MDTEVYSVTFFGFAQSFYLHPYIPQNRRFEKKQGLTNICFYIGATRADSFSWHWTDPSLPQNSCTGNGFVKHWFGGWPSYRETLEDGTEIIEDYAEYIYRKSEDRFYINDVPNDVIGIYPSFAGGMGYICEYGE